MNTIFPKIKTNQQSDPIQSIEIKKLIDQFYSNGELNEDEYLYILDNITNEDTEYLYNKGY